MKGRYYFSPSGTPFYPAVHRLGSRTWNDKNVRIEQGVGESLTAKHTWDNGVEPSLIPGFATIGNNEEISLGQPTSEGIDSGVFISGFNPECFTSPVTASKNWYEASAYLSCSIQLMGIQIIRWSYDYAEMLIRNFMDSFLGPAWTTSWHLPGTLLPAVTVSKSVFGTLVFLDGTVNFQQFALQAAYGLRQPQNFGAYSTSVFWYDAASYVHSVIASESVDPTKPIFLCGHSYGGVVALLLAARYRAGDERRAIRFLTYGCPHIGDDRLVSLCQQCEGFSLANDSDIVTAIPPDYDDLFAVFESLLDVRLLTWPFWKRPPNRQMMDANGVLTPDANVILDYPTLLGFANDVIANLPYPSIQAHTSAEYHSRIFTRCHTAEWPLDADDYAKLNDVDSIATELLEPISTESGDLIGLG